MQPANFTFSDIGDLVKTYDTNCDHWGLEQNIVFRTGIDGWGDKLGQTWICTKSSSGSSTKTFIMNMDANEDWYTGTGNPPPTSECLTYCPDLWAIATHEFGHATGGWTTHSVYGHFDPETNAALCGDSGATDYHTMCLTYYSSTSGSPARGIRWRTLEAHDVDTFEDAY